MNKLLIILLLPLLFIVTSCDSNDAIYCPSGSYGCDGVCASDTVIDDCGICGGLNASMDLNDECCENAVVDECGVCGGDDSLCADGCGVPNGLNPFISYDDCNFICDYTIDETCGYWLSQDYSCTELIEMGHDCSSCESEGFCANPNLFGMEGLCGVTGDAVDCMGICFGTSLIDDCGDCSLPENFNSSQDDCGLCYGENADQDCLGVCFGDAWESDCGCVSGPNFGDDCDDCTGTPNGDAIIDNCGVCDGGNSDQDCAGVCFGDSVLDDCGVCDGGNSDQDCAGVCDGSAVEDCAGECGGSAILDECGVCDSDPNNNCTFNILYNSNIDFTGFQFNVEGLISASGGAAEDAGFNVSAGAGLVLGFDFSGVATIAAGSGILTTIILDAGSSNPCITDIIVSDADGTALDISLSKCLTIVITGS